MPKRDLPDLSALPAEQRDAAWVEHYYAGDGVPQLTLRAVLTGGVLGMLMSISNLYTTLKLGWAFGVAITACVLSHASWSLLRTLHLSRTNMTLLENNCMQSTASAAGYSTGGTLATAVGALLLLHGDTARLGWVSVGMWVLLVAVLGVLLAIPMKRQMINIEQLPFPSGIAAAETLRSLYAEGREAILKARSLLISMAAGGALGLLRGMGKIVEEVPLGVKVGTAKGRVLTGSVLGMAVEPSLLLVAAGMIVGLRVSISMLAGSLLNYLVLAPRVAALADWVQPGKQFVGELEATFAADGALAGLKLMRWSLWLGTATMVSAGLTSFALGWRTVARALFGLGKQKTAADDPVARLEVPASWLAIGGVPVTIGLVLLCWLAFGIAPWLGLVSVLLSFVLGLVACRATGETDTTPIGAMGKITQFLYAGLAPGHTPTNLITAGVTAGAAGSAADLLTDLKSGYLLGAHPRQQFLAQFAGLFFGVIAVVPAWYLLVPNRAALEAFNPPATSMWAAVAAALAQGVHTIPASARLCIVIGGIAGLILPLLEAALPKRVATFVPSAMGLGLAFVVPFANSLAFCVGAVVAAIWRGVHPPSAERYVIPIASGLVAGESLAAAVHAMTANLGIL